jgi:hypothetical protein
MSVSGKDAPAQQLAIYVCCWRAFHSLRVKRQYERENIFGYRRPRSGIRWLLDSPYAEKESPELLMNLR